MSTARRQSRRRVAVARGHGVAFRLRSQVVARRGEHVEDPALAVLVVADEHRVTVPDVLGREVARRPRSSTTRSLARRARRCGSRAAPRTTMPSCSLSAWWCRNDPRGAAVDPPEAQLQAVAGDDAAAEPRPVGLVERVVVEEVAVLVASQARRCSSTTRPKRASSRSRSSGRTIASCSSSPHSARRDQEHHLELEPVRIDGRRGSCWHRGRTHRRGPRRRRAGRASRPARSIVADLPGDVVHARRVERPAVDAAAASAPMLKKAMSWWLSEAGARMNTNRPVGIAR